MKTLNFSISFLIFLLITFTAKGQQSAENTAITDSLLFSILNDSLVTIEDVSPELSLDNRKPLLLIHGWNFAGEPAPPGGSGWENLRNYLKNDTDLKRCFKPYLVKYWSNSVPVKELALELQKKIEEAGLNEKNIVLIGHSMGGLVSRSYMNEQQFTTGNSNGKKCGELVDLLITLSSPHHGSPMANFNARNARAGLGMGSFLAILDGLIFSETKYDEVNRSDLRWDNYDNLFDYNKYPTEKNDWLTNLNRNTQFDSKTICYSAAVEGLFIIPENGNVTEQYLLGSYLIKQSFGFANDGIVPVSSSGFTGHAVKRIRNFANYNHAEIIFGKANKEELFGPIKTDLMEVAPIQLFWPSAEDLYIKHSQYRKITWFAPVTVSEVNLYFSQDNGQTYTSIATKVSASTGEYNWFAPDINSSDCLIKVTNANNELIFDISDNPFTVFHNQITNIAPITDPYFVRGRANNIQWTQVGLGKKVTITYIDQQKGVQQVIADGVSTTSGTNNYRWVVDQSLPPTATGTITISLKDLLTDYGDSEIYTFTSENISLLGDQKVLVKTPTSYPTDNWNIKGERLKIGQTYRIKWETQGEIKFVQLYLCDSLKNILKKIGEKDHAPAYIANGFLDWKVDEYYGDKFFFLIKGSADINSIWVESASENSFRINKLPLIVKPILNAQDVKLFPDFETGSITNATAYNWTVENNSGTDQYPSRYFSSTSNTFSVPNAFENELTPGAEYTLTATVSFNNVVSYRTQLKFSTEDVKPGPFATILPLKNAQIETSKIDLKWNRAIGASSYDLKVSQKNKVVFEKTDLSKADTTISLDISKLYFFETITWQVVAKNEFGETSAENLFSRKYRTGVDNINTEDFSLINFPNPFTNESIVEFTIPEKETEIWVKISVFDLIGNKITTLTNEELAPGKYQFKWNGCNENGIEMKNGIYLCNFSTSKGTRVLRIIKN